MVFGLRVLAPALQWLAAKPQRQTEAMAGGPPYGNSAGLFR
jgi:hypothetical protein